MAVESDEITFDPAKHVRNLSGNEYLDVKWRVVWFRRDNPTGNITTELLHHDFKEGFALFMATARVGDVIVTAHGSETRPDFKDYVEKAETKAIGRALALMGYGTASLPDDGDRIADTPVERTRSTDNLPLSRPQGQTQPVFANRQQTQTGGAHHTIRNPNAEATPKQVDLITRTCARKNVSVEDLEQYVEATYQLDLADLTMGAASDIIGLLIADDFKGFDLPAAGPDDQGGADDGEAAELKDAGF